MVCGVRVVKLNGGMAASAREAALKIYREDPGEPCRVLKPLDELRRRVKATRLPHAPCAAAASCGRRSCCPHTPCGRCSDSSVAPLVRKGVTVILISLKAGGVALNLTVASHIYLMDPWWNPAAEYQAIDRAHRLGQQKPIRAVRFVVRNTVEERILRLQDKKRLVFEGTVGGDAAALGQLSEEDLRFLFQS